MNTCYTVVRKLSLKKSYWYTFDLVSRFICKPFFQCSVSMQLAAKETKRGEDMSDLLQCMGRLCGIYQMFWNHLGDLPVLLDVSIGTLHLGPGDGNHGGAGLRPRDHHAQLILACSEKIAGH